MGEPIRVDRNILQQIKTIRDSGATNMFDIVIVSAICDSLEFRELSDWLGFNKNDYLQGIIHGFVDEDGKE